ncbi:MAG: hypothetical protein H6699_08310 [Myxococcales bacterium]|nr:hypothetical protein [Myxococcales bacterium]
MKKQLLRALAIAFVSASASLAVPSSAAASPPGLIPLQGYLADRATGPVDGDITVLFTLYSDELATTSVWTESRTVPVSNGVFSIYLGETTALPLEVFRDNHDLWLTMTIDGDDETNPVRVGTTPFAAFAEYAGFANEATTLEGLGVDDFARADHTHSWGDIGDIPADLADGDNDTTYDAGAGLSLVDTLFGVDFTAVQARLTAACPDGEFLVGIGEDGSPSCAAPAAETGDIEAVVAGTGLLGGGDTGSVTLDLDLTVAQARVASTCPEGSSIRAINADGTVDCEVDDDTDTTYAAGAGLTLTGDTFAVDGTVVQARVVGACPAGSSISAIAEDGSVTCEVDDDTDTTYDAGAGLALAGTTFSVDATAVQTRVSGACPAGSSISAIAEDGSVTCEVDDDTDTTYGAGAGLALTGTTFSVDAATVQSRVGGVCPPGSAINAIAEDGTVTCEVDDDTNTTYTAGIGLALSGTTFSVNTGVIQARVGSSCPAGSSIRAVAANGTVTCETDDDTTYAAGAGLALTGTTFAVDTTAIQARVGGSCPTGSSISSIAADGTVTCEVDDDTNTTYSAGTGLTLTGTTFAVSPTAVQTRVASTCPAGSSIRAIAANGTVTCEVDDDTDTTYTAGAGLTLTGTAFAVDSATVQARVAATCPAGSSIRAIAADGTVTCETDDDTDTDTTYSAGAGLSLAGTTFSVNTATVQARVAATCPAGSSIRAIAADGTVTCETDDDTDTNTTYTAGSGLSLTGTTFAVDSAAVQTRVAATCPAGSSIRAIAADGTVTCETDDDTDTDTTYTAGTGLSLTGTTFAVNTATIQSRVASTCPAGSSIRAIAANGTVTCETDDDTNTTYTAGTGLALTGTTFSVDANAVQARVAATCPAGSSIRAIAADGTVTCETDDDTDTDTTYSAGSGLALTGTTFSVDANSVQTRVAATCAAGSSIRAIAADGTVTCEIDDNTSTAYAAGTGLTLTGTTFAVNTATVQARVATTCPAGSSIRAIAANGTVTCETDDDTNTTYTAGAGLALTGTTFSVDAAAVQARVGASCPAGSSIRAIAADGTVTCETDDDTDTNTTYTAGTGLALTGTTFSVDQQTIQGRVSGTCAAGSSIRTIAGDGTVTCEADDNTTYTAGTGLTLSGTTFSVNTSTLQTRVSGTCAAGSSIRSIASDGTVVCENDDVGIPGIAYGLEFDDGGNAQVNDSFIQNRVNGLCSTGQYIVGVNQDGSVLCGFDADTVQFAGFGLTESEGYFDVDFDLVQARVTGGCGDGTAIVDIDSEGGVSCEQFGHIDGVYGGAGISAYTGDNPGYVTVNIAGDGIQPYMHSWGVPLDVPFTLNQPVTYCGDSSPQDGVFGAVEGTSEYFIGFVGIGDDAFRAGLSRGRIQINCSGDPTTVRVYDQCETLVAEAYCPGGTYVPTVVFGDVFDIAQTDYYLAVQIDSRGGFMEFAHPKLVLY